MYYKCSTVSVADKFDLYCTKHYSIIWQVHNGMNYKLFAQKLSGHHVILLEAVPWDTNYDPGNLMHT